jgi:Pentapeptide repeats (8 copies)
LDHAVVAVAVDGRVGLRRLKPSRRAEMANEEHLRVLRQGVEAWNTWRKDNPETKPDLRKANLLGADLYAADLYGAVLYRADLSRAKLVGTDFTNADLTGCRIYGISAWDLKLKGTTQKDLIITTADEIIMPIKEPEITIDNLEVAQFIYLLLHNEKIRDVVDTITSKVVLILGRFTPERKVVLDDLREELRKRD